MSATALVSALKLGGALPLTFRGPICLTETMTMKANYDEMRRKMIRETEEYLERRLGAWPKELHGAGCGSPGATHRGPGRASGFRPLEPAPEGLPLQLHV